MYNADTEFLFPLRVTSSLRDCRDGSWNELIDRISGTQSTDLEKAAFTLMMVRLARCVDCDADSFRASQGCTQCAKQMIRRYKGSDAEIENLYRTALKDLEKFQKTKEANR